MVKPPPVPMPGIGGGGITMMKAPSIAESRLRKSAVITARGQPFLQPHLRLLEHRKQRGRIARLGAGRARQARECGDADDAGRIERDALDPANDLGGPRQRGRAGQLRRYDDVAAILRRNIALRRGGDQPARAADQHDIDQQHHHAVADHEAREAAVAIRQPVEAAIEEAGESFPAARHQIPARRRPLVLMRRPESAKPAPATASASRSRRLRSRPQWSPRIAGRTAR